MDIEKLDFKVHNSQIIPSVFMKGKIDHTVQVLRYYDKDIVKNVLLNTRYLDSKTLALAAVYFSTDKKEFRCYKLSQSNPATLALLEKVMAVPSLSKANLVGGTALALYYGHVMLRFS